MESKKDIFKILIKEFHTSKIPSTIKRELVVPLDLNKIITITGPKKY